MKLLIIGDIHGNLGWLRSYIYPLAVTLDVEAIVQCGDFGAWEHTRAGIDFFDQVDELGAVSGIPLYWLYGNHDKVSHTLSFYGGTRDSKGFVVCREYLFHIPQGHAWTWSGVSLRAFGGAYSIDKGWRLDQEKTKYQIMLRQARRQVGQGGLFRAETVPSQDGTLWFPEEEMTDDDMKVLLQEDGLHKDIVLSHDKPLSATPGWDRPAYPACVPNQIRLEYALRAHRPAWWFHGHLHYYYTAPVHGRDWMTTVVGLDTDRDAAESPLWTPERTWALAELRKGETTVQLGEDVTVDKTLLTATRVQLGANLLHRR